ncbi:DinB family protein [Allomuricauda sp. d1]|uniref:DinB family protein n=1 Tax=Allomuricauda sp. d1 TaxID=3136725 RepID=UPI0031D0EC0B
MIFNLNKAVAVLTRTPKVLYCLLSDLPEEWTHQNEGPNTWSPYDIVGHLIHGEQTDWLVRTKIILSNASDKTFTPFNRFAHFENSKGKSLESLLQEFEGLRNINLDQLMQLNLSTADLDKEGTHPELGQVKLKELLAAWVAHDLGHIVQISRVMAKQYKSEVGPWTQYITALKQ